MLVPVFIQARDIPDAWFQCVSSVVKNGYAYEVTEGSYVGQTRYEFDFVTIQITHPWVEPMLPQMPHGLSIPDPVPGGMNYIHKYLAEYLMDGRVAKDETYTYGSRLVGRLYDLDWSGCKVTVDETNNSKDDIKEGRANVDLSIPKVQLSQPGASVNQIEKVIDIFKRGHGTNQATMEIGLPNDCGTIDPPCLRLIDCRVRYGKLHFMVYFRSWDLWGGFPCNVAAIELLKQYMASEIGVENGEIIACSKGLHIYSYAENLAKIRLYREEDFECRRECKV